MTTTDRIDRLPELLTELAAPRTPDYLDDILARTAGQRQRSAHTLLERIIPMSETTLPSLRTSPSPWRTFAIALLLVTLAVALGAAALVASRPRPVPAPFGPAANGSVVFASGGDIFIADPATGESEALVTSSAIDLDPWFSPDGNRIVFLRQGRSNTHDFVVMGADGTNQTVITTEPIYGIVWWDWAPDSASIVVAAPYPGEARLLRYDVTRVAEPTVIVDSVQVLQAVFRPPSGDQILVRGQTFDGIGLYLVNADGSGQRTLVEPGRTDDRGDLSAAWSPDGSMIAFQAESDDKQSIHLFVMNADGTDRREVGYQEGVGWAVNPAWSPDGTRIAFSRWFRDGARSGTYPTLAVVTLADDSIIEAGPPSLNGGGYGWSPDGSSIFFATDSHYLVDPIDGTWQAAEWSDILRQGGVGSDLATMPNWQRLALPKP